MNLIETLEKEEIARLSEGKTFPKMNPGDTVVVNVNVVEGSRKRVQAFEGVIIAIRNRGLNSALPFVRFPAVKVWNVHSSSILR